MRSTRGYLLFAVGLGVALSPLACSSGSSDAGKSNDASEATDSKTPAHPQDSGTHRDSSDRDGSSGAPKQGDGGNGSADVGVDSSRPAHDAGTLLDWAPGHYILLAQNSQSAQATERDTLLGGLKTAPYTEALITPFAGIGAKYFWAACEGAQGDYSAGFAKLDADMAAVAARGKKLIPMLNYKIFDGDQGVPTSAVPTYMLSMGDWCVAQSSGPAVCGQYKMSNGTTAMVWQAGAAARVHAWYAAMAKHVADSPNHAVVAGYVLPESACSEGAISFADVHYAQAGYEQALTDNVSALINVDPAHIAFQYINFLPPNSTGKPFLTDIANFARMTHGAGLGCPDVAPVSSSWDPQGYAILMSSTYQTVVPFNVAIESPDLLTPRATSVASTYDVAVTQMKAGQVMWLNDKSSSTRAFGIGDVALYISTRTFPNVTLPFW